MCNTHNAARATGQGNCDTPRYFVSIKRGWRRYVPPTGEAPFAVQIRDKWHLVHRAATDSEFFAAHPGSPYRMTVRPLNPDDPWIFRVGITTRDGGGVHEGCDNFDFAAALNHVGGGTRRERLKATVCRMLCNPNLMEA